MPRPEFDEPDIFERQEAAARRNRVAIDIEEHEKVERRWNEQAAARAAEHGRKLMDFSRRVILREYAALGLERPPGILVSLSTLASIGWTIGEVMGKRTLIRPPPAMPPERDWQRDGSS